ncbi:MFS transporter [Alicyclobacillus suci]|uniref:MFS transporter n=1 Tax=Alicyclobacillus suci TaxID=2816080 RepID=UPI0016622C95|nr:MFS transporter [Alicyclobacillus suci]
MRNRTGLIILMFASVVAMMPNSVLFPAEGELASHLHRSLGFVGWMVTAYAIAYVCATPVLGMISDFLGRKAVLVVGLCLFAIGGLVPIGFDNPVLILIGRCVMGVGSAGIQPMVDSMIGDMYPRGPARRRAFAFFAGAIAVAEAMMPFLGGVAAAIWWKAVFVLYGSAILAALATVRLNISKQGAEHDERITYDAYVQSLRVAARMPVLAATVLGAMVFGVIYFGISAMMPLAYGGAHTSLANGFLFLPLGFCWVVGAFIFAKVTHLRHLHRLVLCALLVLAGATWWLGDARSWLPLLIISALWGAGSAVLTTVFTWVVGDESPNAVRGAMNGIYNAAYVLGFSVGAPLFISLVHHVGLQNACGMGAVLMALFIPPLCLTYRQAAKVKAAPVNSLKA